MKNETLDKLKEVGKKDIADLEFYPILFREVLKCMPDDVRCKTNVKEMISMFRANLREQELGRIKSAEVPESQRARVPREPKCQRQFPLKMSLEVVILRVMGEYRNCSVVRLDNDTNNDTNT